MGDQESLVVNANTPEYWLAHTFVYTGTYTYTIAIMRGCKV